MSVTFTSHRKEVEKAVNNALLVGLEACGLAGETNAKKEVMKMVYDQPKSPRYKRTGRLLGSIGHLIDKAEPAAYIGAGVTYAIYVHEGARGKPPKRFLRNAAQNYSSQYQRILKDALKTLK